MPNIVPYVRSICSRLELPQKIIPNPPSYSVDLQGYRLNPVKMHQGPPLQTGMEVAKLARITRQTALR